MSTTKYRVVKLARDKILRKSSQGREMETGESSEIVAQASIYTASYIHDLHISHD